MPPGDRRPSVAALLVALVLLGVLTGVLGSAVHLARVSVLGVLVPHGLVLSLALVVACDVAVATAGQGMRAGRGQRGGRARRLGPGRALLAVAAGRGLVLALLLLPRAEGDVVLTGLPGSTAWILLAVLLPAFAAPLATAWDLRAAVRGPEAVR